MRRLLFFMLGMLLISAQVLAQNNRTVSGKVTDDKGAGIANASVVVKGTTVGTTTNNDGNFSLSVPANAKTLVVSYIGLGEKEVTLTSSNSYTVLLSAATKDLSEVVVVAYGQQKRADLTGSVATIKADDIENKPFSSVDKALQGQIAGLQSVAASGAPGSNQQIRIRGIGSISASSAPLWVIDGVPVNTGDASRLTTSANLLSTLNPNDIESVTVLKDAASASVYGSRAANGVIIVTTKKGRAGKTKFRFDTEQGKSDIAYYNDRYRPLNASEYFTITREGLVNAGSTNPDATLASLGLGNGQDYNWFDAVTRKGSQQLYNVSASGGNDKTTFYMSGGYTRQLGTTISTYLRRYSGKIQVTNKATDRLTLGMNLNGGYTQQRTPLSGGAFGNPVLSSLFILPSRNAYKPDGSFNITAPDFPTGSLHNVVALAYLDKRLLRETGIRGNVSADYNIIGNLTFRSNFGIDANMLEEDQYNNPFHGDGFNTAGRAFSYYTRYFNWVSTNTLNYHNSFLKSGSFNYDVTAGYEAQSSRAYLNSVQSQGFPPTTLLTVPSVGATPITAGQTISEYTFASMFSLASLNYKDRYIVSGSFRRDGSSRFGGNNKYGNFWAIGLSWNVDQEAFMQNVDFLSQFKLRGSYGVNGNAGIGNYDWLPLYGYGANYNQQPGSAPSQVGDSNLTWEKNKPLNIGVDLGFLNNRLSVSADWYQRRSSDLLLGVQLSRTTGFSSATRNIGAMENKGVELTIAGVPVQTKHFTWSTNFNFAHNKNKIISLPNHADIVGTFILREGQDIQTFYLREYAGVNPDNGDPLWYIDGTHSAKTSVIANAQRQLVGSASPKYLGGWTNTFNYRGITLEAQFNYNFGNYVQDPWGGYYVGAGFGATFNKAKRVLDRWQKPGDVTDIPKYIYNGNKNFNAASTFYLNQGDFIRLRNVQLGYDLPKSLLGKAKITNAFFYVRGTNVWTWVKDKNLPFDPEQGVASQSNLESFIAKTWTVGLNLGF